MSEDRLGELRLKLQQLDTERLRLLADIHSLEMESSTVAVVGSPAQGKAPDSNDEKVSLFLSLFRCRESVYPKLWENPQKDKKGYAPAA